MAVICPKNNQIVLYLDCLECKEKICKQSGNRRKEQGNGSNSVSAVVGRTKGLRK